MQLKPIYELNGKGEITAYNKNYDIARFSFLPKGSEIIEEFRKDATKFYLDLVGTPSYELDFDALEKQYLEFGIGDVPHFVSQYVFAWFLIRKRANEYENKERMYLQGVYYINEKIENGDLPG